MPAAAVIVAILGGATLVWRSRLGEPGSPDPGTRRRRRTRRSFRRRPPAREPRRRGRDRYFSDGMTDELTSALSKVPGLRVASRTSVVALARKGLGAQEIASTLNVSSVLEGTVRRAGDRLRVSAQLTNAPTGSRSGRTRTSGR